METDTRPMAQGAIADAATIADLPGLAAKRFGDTPALRHKQGGEWRDISYVQLYGAVSEIGRGLIDLGVMPGDRVGILCTSRPEWTITSLAITTAGAVVVPIYPTNSPQECLWVARDAGCKVVVCENAAQADKIYAGFEQLPALETIVVIDTAGLADWVVTGLSDEVISFEVLARLGKAHNNVELTQRSRNINRAQPYTIIYTSGTTGPPKGCVLSHDNYRNVITMCEQHELAFAGDVAYLFLPLAHSFALLVQLLVLHAGATLAYASDPQQIVPELAEIQPTYLPSVPRLFEKIYARATAHLEPEQVKAATSVGLEVRRLRAAGRQVPEDLQARFDAADEMLFAAVRAVFGGRLRHATSGAAPIADAILEFFFACGVPVFEGYGMTETAAAATLSTLEHHRFGSVGRALPGVAIEIAHDSEVLLRGPNVFQGYYGAQLVEPDMIVDGWLHTGDLGHVDADGYLWITGRKKDIIVTAGGKNLTPANLENDLKRSRWISHAVMHGDRRPYPVALITLDAEAIALYARSRGLREDIASLSRDPQVVRLIQAVLDDANDRYALAEQIKKFAILNRDLSQEEGELTPTLKVRRSVVCANHAAVIDDLYAS